MGFWFLDDRTQLALLLAGLMGGVGACDSKPQVVDMVPSDFRVERSRLDADAPRDGRSERRGPDAADPLPRDMRVERRPDARRDGPVVVDMVPPDMRVDKAKTKLDAPIVVDMAPFDMKVDKAKTKLDAPIVVDMAPFDMKLQKDAAAAGGGSPQWQRQPAPAPRRLPLARDLRVQITSRLVDGRLELTATTPGVDPASLAFRWTTSGGTLDSAQGRVARWTPPTQRGLHMVQVTVRDGDRAISIDVHLHEGR